MEIEYGVKTENKFSFADLEDDDEVLDPCEILSRLETNAKEAKNSASTVSKKKTLLTQQKKIIPVINTSDKLAKTTINKSDILRPPRNATNKENFGAADSNKETGPRRFPRGGAALDARGLPRNRPPRQERSDLPPRFRQPNEGDQAFQQNGFDVVQQTNDRGSFQRDDQTEVQQNGFGGGFNNVDESGDGRSFNRSRGFGGRGGGNFGGRSGGGFVGQPRGARRPYDRQSGSDKTGVKAVDKRDGAGAHNWGSAAEVIADDVDRVEQPPTSGGADQATPIVDGQKTTGGEEGEKTAENAQNEAAEPEPVQLTLDEWKAQQGPRQQPQFKVRRPGEGDKNPAWEKLKPLKGGDEPKKSKNKSKAGDVIPVEDEEEEEEYNKVVPINIRFIGEPVRGRGGRGRGGGRGFGVGSRDSGFGRAEFTPKKEQATRNEIPYKIDDESFPSLS